MVASRIEVVRPLEFIDQRNTVVGSRSQFPCSDSDDSDDDVLLVGAVRPLMSAAPLGGTEMLDDCRLQATTLDHVVSDGAWASENRQETCCVRLDDFNWVVPPYAADIIVPGQELDVEIPDVDTGLCVLPDVPVVVDVLTCGRSDETTGCVSPGLRLVRAVCGGGCCGYQAGHPKFAGRGSGNACGIAVNLACGRGDGFTGGGGSGCGVDRTRLGYM